MRKPGPIILNLFLLIAATCSWSSARQTPQSVDGSVRLVLFLAVDQLTPEYFERFGDQFEGGLKYIAERGLFFSDAHQDHANTVTGVGHATMLTGLYPARSGIIGNDWYDRVKKRPVYCTDDPDAGDNPSRTIGPSPKAMNATALGDWLREISESSKVVSISRKDRSAVLMGGKRPTGVYWFETSRGGFWTSNYYTQSLPAWVHRFNETRPADKYFGTTWDRLLSDPVAYRRSTEDDQDGEGPKGFRTFPYGYSGSTRPDGKFYAYLAGTPFIDELTLQFAEEAVRVERLGQRESLDLLAISLSATDAVGHRFGPDSQEIQDMILRLDRYLGDFFGFLDKAVGLSHVVVVVTSDHGVQPLPEVLKKRGTRAVRVIDGILPLVQQLELYLERKFGFGPWIEWGIGDEVYLNHDTIRSRGVSNKDVEDYAARILRRSRVVEDVFTRTELLSGNPHKTAFSDLYLNGFNPANSGDLMVQPKIHHLLISSRSGTTHGTPYPYDTRVPLIFVGPGISPGSVNTRVRTIDIGPTLAELLKIPVPSGLDGRPLIRREIRTQQ